ncbi:MAG: right-handed parallel beta-helix repeat-containing protein [Chitinivibrionales bacterium]|nr:right-handed parallel beta-helix repeat-containing protein [Chitinivibrionales bacterium]
MKAILLLALCLFAVFGTGAQATNVSGIITKDVQWTPQHNPYRIVGDVLVPRGVRLAIAPGVQIIVAKNPEATPDIPQLDQLDSRQIAIKIEGALMCVGKKGNFITMAPENGAAYECGWYGVVFNGANDKFCELAFTAISGASAGITVNKCGPLVRNCILEYNNAGAQCNHGGDLRLYNCNVAYNFIAGIRVDDANPQIMNSLIVFNRNNGLWCDGRSAVTFEYNCVFGNPDGNQLSCDPRLGALAAKNGRKDSCDFAHNIYKNPIFAGSGDDSAAVEGDVTLATDKSRITDTVLARVLHRDLVDSQSVNQRHIRFPRYTLSKYSPCIGAGNPNERFNNADKTKNTMGVFGGPDFSRVRD